MMHRGIILCGPPASGKNTITQELSGLSPRYILFRKLKAGTGNGATYRHTTFEEIQGLRSSGNLLQSSQRYGNAYAVDRGELEAVFDQDAVPVIHMGDLAGVRALQAYPAAWLSVLLRCPRRVTKNRLRDRGANDIATRLTAWDEAACDLSGSRPGDFDLRIDTEQHTASESAQAIHKHLMESTLTTPITK
jgi:guanylate kinase